MQKRYKEFICGWTAGCIETCLLFPQTKVIFRQQLHNLHVVDAVKQVKILTQIIPNKNTTSLAKKRGLQEPVSFEPK